MELGKGGGASLKEHWWSLEEDGPVIYPSFPQEKRRELKARREQEEREEKEREEAVLRQMRPKRRRRRPRVEEEEEEEGFYQRHRTTIWAAGLVLACAVVMGGSLGTYLVLWDTS